ncbi:cobalamin-binding protein [Calidifontibacillus erzurumensis]|uniref:cobalamin-binding protein n=1 Tax=Calidifontibacillus erzurumensis TaxID=2741433 RepID=UPI0035B56A36
MKIISICPSNTEIAAYLGLTSSLMAVDNYSDWPEEVKTLPKLGPDLNIDMDQVEELKPDLVLASLSVPGMERNIKELEKRNIPYVIVPNPTSLKELAECMLFVGKATNREAFAKEWVDKFYQLLETYRDLSNQVENPKKIYWEWWAKPIFTPGASNWLTEMSTLAGGINIFQDHPEASIQTNWEEVIQRNPEVMCIVWVGVQKERINPNLILNRPHADQIKAIRDKELYILEEPLFCRPSPRLLVGLQKLGSLLHPQLYPPFDEQKDPFIGI